MYEPSHPLGDSPFIRQLQSVMKDPSGHSTVDFASLLFSDGAPFFVKVVTYEAPWNFKHIANTSTSTGEPIISLRCAVHVSSSM